MLNKELLEAQLSELPLYIYHFFDPKGLEFSRALKVLRVFRVRLVLQALKVFPAEFSPTRISMP